MIGGRDTWSNARRIAVGVARDAKQCLPPLLGYEVLFKIASVTALVPLSAWLVAALVRTSGGVAVSNEQILSFLASPAGVVTVLVAATGTIAILFAEQAGLLLIATNSLAGGTYTTVGALGHVARRLPELLKLALLQVAAYLLCLVPVLGVVGVTYAALLSGHDINYYLTERPPAFWLAASIGAVAGAALLAAWAVLYVRWVFALPANVLAGERAVAALGSSFRLSRRLLPRIVIALGAWLVIHSALGAITGAILWLAEQLLLGLAGQALDRVILAVAAIWSLDVLAALVLSFLGITTHCLLVARLYVDARAEAGNPLPVPHQGGSRPGRLRLPVRRRREVAVFVGALAFLGLSAVTSYSVVETLDVEDRVAVTAHRANTGKAPENTLSAIAAAAQSGAQFAEIDAQETADGVVVVLHDADLMRVAGLDRKIWEITYEELRDVDVGSWFSPEFADQRVPTLERAIEAARGRIKLNIELKFNGHDQKLAERVAGIVRRAGFESQCVVSSLDYEGLREAKRHNPQLTAGFVIFRAIGDVWRLDVDFLSLNANQVDEALLHRARRNGKAVHAWTVNDRPTMVRLVELGVDNVITDDPEMLVSLLRERAELSDVERLLIAYRNGRTR